MADANPLAAYNAMRDFAQSPEPSGQVTLDRKSAAGTGQRLSFVIQKHAARRLHYDFRLELDGTLKSWAVPKGPSLDPADKRMAVEVEDHPLSYASFEGVIPANHYGAGSVIVWDNGDWEPLGDPHAGLEAGSLKFRLFGQKLHGRWALVRMKPRPDEKQPAWLLIKERDDAVRPASDYSVVDAEPTSVLTPGATVGPGPATTTRRPAKPTTEKSAVKRSATKQGTETGATPVRSKRVARSKTPAVALPDSLAPQLATLVTQVPAGDDWLYEIKFDGYRLLTRVEGDDVRCITRNGNDWSHKLPALVEAIRALKLGSAWLDGEIVVAGANGVPDFQALQNAFDAGSTGAIEYFVFDLMFDAGGDLRAQPLSVRRERLAALLGHSAAPVHFSANVGGDPKALLESAAHVGLEGLIGKRVDSVYQSRRSPDWIKLKTMQRQEFVIGGYTDPKGSRDGIGALLLGVHDEHGRLRYAGNVGTGFNAQTLSALKAQLTRLRSDDSPFSDAPRKVGARGDLTPHWVRPTLVAEVSFVQWTKDHRIRHSSFQGLRSDKPAGSITREMAVKPAPTAAVSAVAAPAKKIGTKRAGSLTASLPKAFRVTHAARVVDAESGTTKGELVTFYAAVSALILPHLKARPVAMLRAPDGVAGPHFFQKHADAKTLPELTRLDPALDPGHAALLEIGSQAALLAVSQMNVIELHNWNSTTRAITKPDRMVFDLDPGEGVAWGEIQEAATLLKSMLDELALRSFLKTSGGKGLHVVVPLAPKAEWQVVRQFSQVLVEHLASVVPERFVAKSGPKNRVGRIYVDYLRNGWGSTTAVAWSLRARPGLGVSVPVAWDELAALRSGAHWTVSTAADRLALGNAPWADYFGSRQSLAAAMKTFGFDPKTLKKK